MNKLVLITFLLVSCSAVEKRNYKVQKRELSAQEKIIGCVNALMRVHGVTLKSASSFCFKNYRRGENE